MEGESDRFLVCRAAAAKGAWIAQLTAADASGATPVTIDALPVHQEAEPFEELRDRADELAAALAARGGPPAPGKVPAAALEESVREQALSALLNLGYPKARAERVLAGAAEETGGDATIETLVRAALKRLAWAM